MVLVVFMSKIDKLESFKMPQVLYDFRSKEHNNISALATLPQCVIMLIRFEYVQLFINQ